MNLKTGSIGPNLGNRSPGVGCTFEQQGMLKEICQYSTYTVLPVPDILKHVSSFRSKIIKKSVFHYVMRHVFMLVRYVIRFQCLC